MIRPLVRAAHSVYAARLSAAPEPACASPGLLVLSPPSSATSSMPHPAVSTSSSTGSSPLAGTCACRPQASIGNLKRPRSHSPNNHMCRVTLHSPSEFSVESCTLRVQVRGPSRAHQVVERENAYRQCVQRVLSHRFVCRQAAAVELVGRPAHDAGIHAILHCQHGAGAAVLLLLEALEQGGSQTLHTCNLNLSRRACSQD